MRDLEHLIPSEQQQRSPEYMPQPEEFMQCAEYTKPPTEYNEFPEGHWEETVQDKAADDSQNESESGVGSGERSRNKNQRDGKRGRADRAEKAKKQARVQQKSKSFMSRAGSRIGSAFPMVGMTVGIAMTVVVASVASDGAFLPGVAESAVAVAGKLNTPMVIRQEGLAVEEVVAAFSEEVPLEEKDIIEKLAEAELKDSKDSGKKTAKADKNKDKESKKKDSEKEKKTDKKSEEDKADKNADNRLENNRPNSLIGGITPSGGGSNGIISGSGNVSGSGTGTGAGESGQNDNTVAGNEEVPGTPDISDVPEEPNIPETPDIPEEPETPVVPEVPHTHEYTWEVVTAAACTTDGVQRGTCGCGETVEESIPATGHTLEIMAAVAPTCEWTGLTEGEKCSVCGEILKAQETIGVLPHTEVPSARIEATCTAEGREGGTECSVCKAEITPPMTIPMIPHQTSTWTNIGTTKEHIGTCDVCSAEVRGAHSNVNNYCDECGRAIAVTNMYFIKMNTNRFNGIVKFPEGQGFLNGWTANVELLKSDNEWNIGYGSPTKQSYLLGTEGTDGNIDYHTIGFSFESLDSVIPEGEAVIKITANNAGGKLVYQSIWKLTIGNADTLQLGTQLGTEGENTIVEVE